MCMCMCTYRLGLDQTHVVVPSVEEVVLVHDVMLACEEFTCQQGDRKDVLGARLLTRCSDQPNRTLGLGHDPATGVEIDLRTGVQVVVRSPHPQSLHAHVSTRLRRHARAKASHLEVRARLRGQMETHERREAVVAAGARRGALRGLEVRAGLCA